MTGRRWIPVIACALVLLTATAAAAQQDFNTRKRDLGLELGVLFEGEAYFAEPDKYSAHSSGVMIRAFYDYYVAEKLSVGLFGHFVPTEFPRYDTATLYEIGVSVKPRFMATPTIAVKPGLNIGQRMYTSDTEITDMTGLGLNFSLEFQFDIQKNFIPVGEFGFLAQPAGGNDITDVTYDPIFYLAGGVVF